MNPTNEKFPTRQFPYRKSFSGQDEGLETAAVGSDPNPLSSKVHRFVLGVDVRPREMSEEEIRKDLRDPFGSHLLSKGIFPLTLRTLLAAFDPNLANGDEGLPEQKSFLVADGGQIHWTAETANVPRHLRFAISRSRGREESVLISTGTGFDSLTQFLQLLAWDSTNEVFNYYERRGGTWIWAGNSYHALSEPSRGKGPFDSHVNGSLVMKELKLPWTHWHSQASAITDDVLAPEDALRKDPIWRNKSGAEDFEKSIVRPGIERWTSARLRKSIGDPVNGTITGIRGLMRHLLETTTVNLVASDTQSRSVSQSSKVKLPLSFFLNRDAFLDVIELEPDIRVPEVSGGLYLRNLESFDFHLSSEGFRRPGDTHFAFLVPEAAFEDVAVLKELLRRKVVGDKLAACLLMIDFCNPISSRRRALLMQYVSETSVFQDGVCELDNELVVNIEHGLAAKSAVGLDVGNSVESEFLSNWRMGDDWRSKFESRIEAYFSSVSQNLQTQNGYDMYVRLAESRRREFRRRPLAEFDLTLPLTNIPHDAAELQMFADGSVGPKEIADAS